MKNIQIQVPLNEKMHISLYFSLFLSQISQNQVQTTS